MEFDMTTNRNYTLPVHRSLLERELILGIPPMGILILLLLGTFFVYILKQYITIIPIVLLYAVMRLLTSKDPYMIDIVIEHINQKDILLP
jgi:type IV secretory pathway VirB3-like protein